MSKGEPNTLDYRVYLTQTPLANSSGGARVLSFWHDVPLKSMRSLAHQPIFHYVNEIPKGTTAKNEVSGEEEGNPIRQDTKNGKPRYSFPFAVVLSGFLQLRFLNHGPVLHNYGCLPQTWEDPSVKQTPEQLPGDNDPVDVLEIGDRVLGVGEVVEVRLLGAMALVDEDECDWKLIAINVADPKAATVHDIADVPQATIDAIREWYRVYKVIDGKPANRYAYDGKAFGKVHGSTR